MQIVDVISALFANDEELWQFLGDYWGLNTDNGFIKCYGLFTESKKADLVGCVSHTLRENPSRSHSTKRLMMFSEYGKTRNSCS